MNPRRRTGRQQEDGVDCCPSTPARRVYWADNAPLATATFSPKGSCGDRISSGSFGAKAPEISTTGDSDIGTSFSDLGESDVGCDDLQDGKEGNTVVR